MKNALTVLSKSVLCFIIALMANSCSNDDYDPAPDGQSLFLWEKMGLDGIKVNSLVLEEDLLFAATENGVFKKNIDQDGPFEAIGLQGKNVEDVLVYDGNEILASVADFQEDILIYITSTTDGGGTWQLMETNFGGGFEPHTLWDFLRPSNSGNIIYATSNYLLAKSEDKGITWTPIWGDWDQFAKATSAVAINPMIPSEIWLGGQGGIEDGYLVRLENEVETNRWLDLVPNPTTAKKIVFDNETPQTIYVGFEGALMSTSTNGQAWKTLIDEHESARFFNSIAISSQDNSKIYAAGWLKTDEPQPLLLYYSTDKGATWNQEVFEDESFGGVEAMVLVAEGNQDRLFLGLNKGGVYEVRSK